MRLTEKETNILKYLYRAGGKSVAREELLAEVWGYNAGVTTHTLETHIYRLRQKDRTRRRLRAPAAHRGGRVSTGAVTLDIQIDANRRVIRRPRPFAHVVMYARGAGEPLRQAGRGPVVIQPQAAVGHAKIQRPIAPP